MVLLAHQSCSVSEIAHITFRSQDTVLRHLHRFVSGGLRALPRRKAPGAAPTITPVWEGELLRVIGHDPHTLGVPSANWTTTLRATYLARVTGALVSGETVRLRLHANGQVCKRPTWTLKRKAEAQEGYVGTILPSLDKASAPAAPRRCCAGLSACRVGGFPTARHPRKRSERTPPRSPVRLLHGQTIGQTVKEP